jgi:iturin family lipopeptide synthetase A
VDEHYLVLIIHHLITDGWSVAIVLGELWNLYAAEAHGKQVTMHQPGRYSDYVQRQSDSCAGGEAESYWLKQFSGAVPALNLPTDRPRPPLQTYEGARQRLLLDQSLRTSLKKLSAKHGCTIFITLLGAFQGLLHRLTGQDDLVVGIHASGQASAGDENLMGFCISMLPLRSRLSADPTFAELLAATKRNVFDAQQHQHYPFGNLVKKLGIVRDASRPPLVSAIFNLDRATGARGEAMVAGLEVTRVPSPVVFARFDLLWNLIETDSQLAIDCTYNRDLFNAGTVERWLNTYHHILHAIANDPQIKLTALDTALRKAIEQEEEARAQELKAARLQRYRSSKRQAVIPTLNAPEIVS